LDRSLWLLLWLRARALVRRWGQNFRTLKGLLLAVVGGLVFGSMLLPMLFTPRIQTEGQNEAIRRYGPLALLLYCVLNVMLTTGDRVVSYTPAEVCFLFSGPYRPRQLLLYRIVSGLAAASLTAFFMTLPFTHDAMRWFAAYIAMFLTFALLYLFGLTLGLIASTISALAVTRARQIVLLIVLVALALPVYPLATTFKTTPPLELVTRFIDSPTVAIIVAPFRPFVYTFTSQRIWPDLLEWSALALLVDALLLTSTLAMNARFLETSAESSARLYDRLQRMRRGGVVIGATRARYELPMLPWLGGAGPNLWRQLTTASRSLFKLVGILLIFLLPIAAILISPSSQVEQEGTTALFGIGYVMITAVFVPTMIGFDFRPDIARMEDLKSLPIAPTRLVLGQLLAPVLILCALEWACIGLILLFARSDLLTVISALALLFPLNLLMVAIENLYCLWFPVRMTAVNSFDLQMMGRQLLLILAKSATLVVAGGLAGALATAVYYATGQRWEGTIATAWVVMLLSGLGLVPLVALAFDQFDVSQTIPE
jgi:hypothetical protein